jgi:peptidyl-dipeptidase A
MAMRIEQRRALIEIGQEIQVADLPALTGPGEMDATAILDYFAPFKEWLDRENQARTCGW